MEIRRDRLTKMVQTRLGPILRHQERLVALVAQVRVLHHRWPLRPGINLLDREALPRQLVFLLENIPYVAHEIVVGHGKKLDEGA